MMITPRSRRRSPGRWTGSGAGTRPGACRPSAVTQARKRLGRKVFAELFERTCGPVAGESGPAAAMTALGTARGSFLRNWRLLAIDGFEVDVPDSGDNAASSDMPGPGQPVGVPQSEGGGDRRVRHPCVRRRRDRRLRHREKTLAQRLYPRLCPDELLTADRGFYSWQAWDTAQATGAALLWRAPTQLGLPVVRVLPDGTYLTVLIKPAIRGRQRERLLAAARAGEDLDDISTVPDAFDEQGLPVVHLARVVEYGVPDRDGSGTGELIVLLSTILGPDGDHGARAGELAAGYHQRWEEETGNDQLKTHLRGPGRVLRSRLPDLVYQEIWSYLIVHHAVSALTAQASAAADLDPDRISFAKTLRLIRRTATGTADIPPSGLD